MLSDKRTLLITQVFHLVIVDSINRFTSMYMKCFLVIDTKSNSLSSVSNNKTTMANPNQYQSYSSTLNTPQSLPCNYVQTWNNKLLAPVPVTNSHLTVQRENIPIVPPHTTTGNIISFNLKAISYLL